MTGKFTFGGLPEEEGRAAIIAEALTWSGTPYVPEAMVKGVGVDCGKLVLASYANSKTIPPMEVEHYAADWHKHKKDEKYLEYILRHGHIIPAGRQKPGDVAMWRFGNVRSHGGIIVNWPIIVHATFRERTTWVCNCAEDLRYPPAEAHFYSYW